ncbi:putative nicotinate-nucleotide adenylyltransferase [Trichinella pseudospiralis]
MKTAPLWGLHDRIELCSIAERASYMHAGETCYLEAILVTGDMDSKNKNIMKIVERKRRDHREMKTG